MENNEVIALGLDENERKLYKCPECGDTIKINKSSFNGVCKSCGLTLVDYVPTPHQKAFHESNATYKLNMGGYGTGKTTSSAAEIARHMMTVPNGRTLLTSATLNLVKDAVLPEILKFIPKQKIKSIKKVPTEIHLINGHELLVYASDDEEKLRSLNLTAFYIEEASNLDYKIFTQLRARLRNTAAVRFDEEGNVVEDLRMGIISSNPEQGWLLDEFLLMCNKIHHSEHVDVEEYHKLNKEKNPEFEAFLSSSFDNPYLPRGWVESLIQGNSQNWVNQYIYCSLGVTEGAVYPEFLECLVDDFPIPKHWKRIAGFDKGFAHPTTMIIGAIDPTDGTIYFHTEYSVAHQPIPYHAEMVKTMIKGYDLLFPIQADPSIRNKNDHDGRSYQDLFYAHSGIWLDLAENSIDAGIERVRTYMNVGKIKFFRSLVNLKEEMVKYVYKEGKEKPIEVGDDLVDALRYAIMALPENPNDFNPSTYRGLGGINDFWETGKEEETLDSSNIFIAKDWWQNERDK